MIIFMMTSKSSYFLKIFGHVQGVFFRQSSLEKALSLNLTGWVKNVSDGTVEAYIYGPETACQTFITWCHQGPITASVSKVEVHSKNVSEQYPTFSIIAS